MTHADLVLAAVRWLRAQKCRPVFAEMTTAASETPDAIGWHFGLSHVVECKVSRSDLLRDRDKGHRHMLGVYRWVLVADGVSTDGALHDPRFGILVRAGSQTRLVSEATPREVSSLGHQEEARLLLSAYARSQKGSILDTRTGRWESFLEREQRQRSVS